MRRTDVRWLLVVIAFGTNASGAPQNGSVYWKPYASEEECNRVGRNLRDVLDIPAGRRSVSVCVPENAFDARDWQVLQ
jgi:hypothetical protein